MDFLEYKKVIKDVPCTRSLEFMQAILWLNPTILPLGVVSIGEEVPSIVKVPALRRITIPCKIKSIGEGTFLGCDKLEDVYFEGTKEEWDKMKIVHDKHEIEFGKLIPGTPVHEIKAERLLHVPGNDALLTANIHFYFSISSISTISEYEIRACGRDITDYYRTMKDE